MGKNFDIGLIADELRTLPLDERVALWIALAEQAHAAAASAAAAELAAAKQWQTAAAEAEERLIRSISALE